MKVRIKQYRLRRTPKILQKELADEIKVDPAQISQMERGHYIPSLRTALKVADAFSKLLGKQIHVDDLWKLDRSDKTITNT